MSRKEMLDLLREYSERFDASVEEMQHTQPLSPRAIRLLGIMNGYKGAIAALSVVLGVMSIDDSHNYLSNRG